MGRDQMTAETSKGGRPTDYTPELAEAICDKIANREPVHQFAGKDGFPSETTIYRWLADDSKKEFREMYTHARERAGHRFAHAALDIADKTGRPEVDSDGNVTVLTPDVARVKIDTLKWAAGKFAGRVYGDKIQQEVTGANGGALEIKLTKADENL